MTDEIKKPTFKAPPPPKGLQMPRQPDVKTQAAATPVASAVSVPTPPTPAASLAKGQQQVEGVAVTDENTEAVSDPYASNFAKELNLPPKILQTKIMGSILAGLFLFGIMMGCAMFAGSSKQVVQGLTDVVLNPDIRANLRRCGQIDPNRECVLYIMNAKTFDRLGSDFFQEAQNITGVQKYTIQLSNVRYANALIRPGYIAQIYIPARR